MKVFTLFIFVFYYIFNFYSQNKIINWGKLEKYNGGIMDIFPLGGEEFYVLRKSGGAFFGNYQLTRNEGLTNVSKGKILLKANDSMANFEGITCVGNKVIIFLSDKRDKKNVIYAQEYDSQIKPIGEVIKIGEYDANPSNKLNEIKIITSKNRDFFGLIWESNEKKDVKKRFYFSVFDINLNPISEGFYELPYESEFAEIQNHHLTNNGNYFISIKEFEEPESKKIFNNNLKFKAFHISKVTSDGLIDFKVDLNDQRVEELTIDSDENNILTLMGLFGKPEENGTTGVFYLVVNFELQSIINSGFRSFGFNFITQDLNEKNREKLEKKIENGKEDPQLFNYKMRDVIVLNDGSILGTIEQYYVITTMYSDPRTGTTRTNNSYYYNDIIAYKVGINGQFDWLVKINKQQSSNNDNGPYSSYTCYLDKGKLCLLFNDNNNNYDDKGFFINEKTIYPSVFINRKNTLAQVQIDIENGIMKREKIIDSKEIDAMVIPKLSIEDYVNNKIILVAVSNNKEMFGTISIEK